MVSEYQRRLPIGQKYLLRLGTFDKWGTSPTCQRQVYLLKGQRILEDLGVIRRFLKTSG